MGKMKKYRHDLITFFLIFIVLFGMQFIVNFTEDKYVFGDAGHYYSLGKSMFMDGKFSLYTLADDFRGYAFPLFMGLCYKINLSLGINNSFFYISSLVLAFLLTLFFCFFDAHIGKYVCGCEKNIQKRGLSIAFLLIFFWGLVIYPLTDLYAALICICSVGMIYQAIHEKNKTKAIVQYLLGGGGVYLAYNIRTIYQLTLLIMVVYIFLCNKDTVKNKLISTCCYLCGCLAFSIPQMLINYEKYAKISIWINNDNLFARQLFWGLTYSRYATFIGDAEVYRAPMYFMDEVGVKIIEKMPSLSIEQSILGYVELFFHYPLEYISIIGKHLVNAIFVIFPEQYIFELGKNRYLYILLSVFIVYIFMNVLKRSKEKIPMEKLILIFCMMIPSIVILLGAVEERFLVMPYLIIYSCISHIDYRCYVKKYTIKEISIEILKFAIFAIVVLCVESEILSSLADYPLIFRGN